MYLWRKVADPYWLSGREERLQARARGALATIARPGRRRVQIEIACTSRNESRKLVQEFGGRAKKLRRDWLKRFAHKEKPKPLRIGKQLVVVRSPTKRETGSLPRSLIVPAGAAFGTGEHATTAMLLRLLEQVTRGNRTEIRCRSWNGQWNPRPCGQMFRRASHRSNRCRSNRNLNREGKRPFKQDRQYRFSIGRCASVEAGWRDRNRHRESLQRITDRDPAETKANQLVDALWCFADPRERIRSRSTAPQDRDRRSAPSREMDCSFSEK
jgi:hypothetical protein